MDDEAIRYSASVFAIIVFLVPDEVLRMSLAYWAYMLIEYLETVYAEQTEHSNMENFNMSVHVLLQLLMKIDNMRGSVKAIINY